MRPSPDRSGILCRYAITVKIERIAGLAPKTNKKTASLSKGGFCFIP